MSYGGSLHAVTPIYSGFVNGDSASSLATQPTCSTTPTSSSPVRSYPSSCSGAADPNYAITYIDGRVKIVPVPLTITASSASIPINGPPPIITPIYSGFVNGDSASRLFVQLSCLTDVNTSLRGAYTSTCSGAVDLNYTITYVEGTVTVTG